MLCVQHYRGPLALQSWFLWRLVKPGLQSDTSNTEAKWNKPYQLLTSILCSLWVIMCAVVCLCLLFCNFALCISTHTRYTHHTAPLTQNQFYCKFHSHSKLSVACFQISWSSLSTTTRMLWQDFRRQKICRNFDTLWHHVLKILCYALNMEWQKNLTESQ